MKKSRPSPLSLRGSQGKSQLDQRREDQVCPGYILLKETLFIFLFFYRHIVYSWCGCGDLEVPKGPGRRSLAESEERS